MSSYGTVSSSYSFQQHHPQLQQFNKRGHSNSSASTNNSPYTQDSASMTTDDDPDFQRFDRSSSFETSANSSIRDYPHHTSSYKQQQSSNNRFSMISTVTEASLEKDQSLPDISNVGFYSGPSFNLSGLNNQKHARHVRKSLVVSPSLKSIKTILAGDENNLPKSDSMYSIAENEKEVPTNTIGMTNSPSLQALSAILNKKVNHDVSPTKEIHTITEVEEHDTATVAPSTAPSSNRHSLISTATSSNGHSLIDQDSFSIANGSVASFYTAHSVEIDNATFGHNSVSGIDEPDLISLSSTIKSVPNDDGKFINADAITAGNTPDINLMTPQDFSPAMTFNQPVKSLSILNHENKHMSLENPVQLTLPNDKQSSNSIHKLGYDHNDDDDIDFNFSPIPSPNKLGVLSKQENRISMRLVRDSASDDVRRSISTSSRQPLETPKLKNPSDFQVDTPSPNFSIKINDTPSTFHNTPNLRSSNFASPAVSTLHAPSVALSPSLNNSKENLSSSRKSLRSLKSFKSFSSSTSPNPNTYQSTNEHLRTPKNYHPTETFTRTPEQQAQVTGTPGKTLNHKKSKLTFKGLFKRSNASSSSLLNTPSTDEYVKKTPKSNQNATMPSPAISQLSQMSGNSLGSHFRSKSFASFTSPSTERPHQKAKKSATPTAITTKSPAVANVTADTKKKEKKEKHRSLFWKRKSFAFGQPLEDISNKDTSTTKTHKSKLSFFSKSKSMDNIAKASGKSAKGKENKTVLTSGGNANAVVSKSPKITLSISTPQLNSTTYRPDSQKPNLLSHFGFDESDSSSKVPQGPVLSNTPIESNFQFNDSPELQKTPTYNSNTNRRTSLYYDAATSTSTNDIYSSAELIESSPLKNKSDNTELPPPTLTPIQEPVREVFSIHNSDSVDSFTATTQKSLRPGLQITTSFNNKPTIVTTPVADDDATVHPYSPLLDGDAEFGDDRSVVMTPLSKLSTSTITSSPSKLHPGDSVFPRRLSVDEVNSIISIERSKSMRSIKSLAGNGSIDGSGSTVNNNKSGMITPSTSSRSIVGLVNQGGDFDELVTDDGRVIVRSPSKGSVRLSSPLVSRRGSILKNSSSDSPIKRGSIHSVIMSGGRNVSPDENEVPKVAPIVPISLKSSVPKDYSKKNLNELIDSVDFGRDDEKIDTNFDNFDVNFDDDLYSNYAKESDKFISSISPPPPLPDLQLEPSPMATNKRSKRLSVTPSPFKQQEHNYHSSQLPSDYKSFGGDDLDSLNSYEEHQTQHPLSLSSKSPSSKAGTSPLTNPFIPQFQPIMSISDDEPPPSRPISMSFKGLRGPTFNSSLKPSTKNAIMGSLAHTTGSHTSLYLPPSESSDSIPSKLSYSFVDEPSRDFEDYIAESESYASIQEEPEEEEDFEAGPSQYNYEYEEEEEEEEALPSPPNERDRERELKKSRRLSLLPRINYNNSVPAPKAATSSSNSRNNISGPPSPSYSRSSSPANDKPRRLIKRKQHRSSNSNASSGSMSVLSMFSTSKVETTTTVIQRRKSNENGGRRMKVKFSSRILLYDTYAEDEYDRYPETATCNNLTPQLAVMIKNELNELKSEMQVHESSRCYTHFY